MIVLGTRRRKKTSRRVKEEGEEQVTPRLPTKRWYHGR